MEVIALVTSTVPSCLVREATAGASLRRQHDSQAQHLADSGAPSFTCTCKARAGMVIRFPMTVLVLSRWSHVKKPPHTPSPSPARGHTAACPLPAKQQPYTLAYQGVSVSKRTHKPRCSPPPPPPLSMPHEGRQGRTEHHMTGGALRRRVA
ncbi:unnamed protein product [Rodentolepis nana]|uniref:Uncharacterized protein n=1 Tax=Rodentolepis nana TaxID=102285 RepID=A0A3P7SPS9_RODNA|nr:unnamed protein product [Rodentolepis nana]